MACFGGSALGSGASKGSEVGRLRRVELWVAALLLLLTLAAVGAVAAMLSEVVFASGEPKSSSPRAAVPTSSTPATVAAASAAPAPLPVATPPPEPALTPTTASVPTEQVALVAPTAAPAPVSPVASAPPLPKSESSAPVVAPRATPRPVAPPVTAAAPSDRELAQRRCAAIDSYIAELRSQAAGSAAPWVGEQLQTALARRTELGCTATGRGAGRPG